MELIYKENYAYNKYYSMLKEKLTSKLLLRHDLMKQTCLLASNQIFMRTLELIPYQKAKERESLAIDSLLKPFFSSLLTG
jgi:hypothetical protein